jgi:hypothetical protein
MGLSMFDDMLNDIVALLKPDGTRLENIKRIV